jgi:hypothetical protein
MKIIFFLFTMSLLLSQTGITKSIGKQASISVQVAMNRVIDSANRFEIWRIDSVQSVFIIYAKRNDSIIKIVSKKEMLNDCKPIFKGQLYNLNVESLLKHTSSKRHIGGVKYSGILVKLEGGEVIWDLFVSEDLKGLCYNPSTLVACKKKKKKKA